MKSYSTAEFIKGMSMILKLSLDWIHCVLILHNPGPRIVFFIGSTLPLKIFRWRRHLVNMIRIHCIAFPLSDVGPICATYTQNEQHSASPQINTYL